MSAAFPADLKAWLAAKGITADQLRSPATFFSDGVLVAQIVASSFPRIVDTKAFPATLNTQRRRQNWELLWLRVLRKIDMALTAREADLLPSRTCDASTLAKFLIRLKQKMKAFEATYRAGASADAQEQERQDDRRHHTGMRRQRERAVRSRRTGVVINEAASRERAKATRKQAEEESSAERQSTVPARVETTRASPREAGRAFVARREEAFGSHVTSAEMDTQYAAIVERLRAQQAQQAADNRDLMSGLESIDAEVHAIREQNHAELETTEQLLLILRKEDHPAALSAPARGVDASARLRELALRFTGGDPSAASGSCSRWISSCPAAPLAKAPRPPPPPPLESPLGPSLELLALEMQ